MVLKDQMKSLGYNLSEINLNQQETDEFKKILENKYINKGLYWKKLQWSRKFSR